ncbi:hypothetical protein JTB14_033362 [Gonioctena quinquepunctata]|nr:hypothetical protein JTB14_033362 [Gonioctena quinquepunctata]
MSAMPNDVTLADSYKLLMIVDDKCDKTQDKLAEIKTKVEVANNRIAQLDDKNSKRKSLTARLDNKTKRNNIIVFHQSENIVQSLRDLGDSLEIKLDLQDTNNTFFLPNRSGNEILKIEFISY